MDVWDAADARCPILEESEEEAIGTDWIGCVSDALAPVKFPPVLRKDGETTGFVVSRKAENIRREKEKWSWLTYRV